MQFIALVLLVFAALCFVCGAFCDSKPRAAKSLSFLRFASSLAAR
jgi:ABC-type Na+ efflux pump permease subunit